MPSVERSRPAWLLPVLRLATLALGAAQAVVAALHQSMNADGVNYLDMGDALLRGDWSMALSSVWSPLYGWLLGLVNAVARAPMRWEFPLVHAVNLAIYAVSMLAFEFLMRRLDRVRDAALPDWAFWSLGYGAFAWAALCRIHVWSVTPDLLMSVFVYVAAGLVVGWRLAPPTTRSGLLLGAVLGAGYLAKSPMLPIGCAFLVAALLAARPLRRALPALALAALAFVVVPLPYVAAVSWSKGRFTLGDAGSSTYLRHVRHIRYPHWQGEPPDFGVPLHPTRRVLDDPPVYEFAEPIGGTYPVSYDPGYWYAGASSGFDWHDQLAAIAAGLRYYREMFLLHLAGPTLGLLVLFALGARRASSLRERLARHALALPALGGLALYLPILVEGRYVGVFVALLAVELLAGLRARATSGRPRLVPAVCAAMLVLLAADIAWFHLGRLSRVSGRRAPAATVAAPGPSWPGAVAEALQRAGVQPGDAVGVIGYGFDAYWARLAHVHIAAELLIDDAAPLWGDDPAPLRRAEQAFARVGVRAVVAEHVPLASLPGWRRVERSSYWLLVLPSG